MENGISGIKSLESKLNDVNIIMSNDDREAYTSDLERKSRIIRLIEQMRRHHNSKIDKMAWDDICLLYTSPSPRDRTRSRMPSSA